MHCDLNSQLEGSIPLRVLKSVVTVKVSYAWLTLDVNISGSTCHKWSHRNSELNTPPPPKKIIIKEYHPYPQHSINFVQTKCYKGIHWQFGILSITVSFISGLSYRKRYILRGFLAVQKIASIVAASKYNIKVRSVYDPFLYILYTIPTFLLDFKNDHVLHPLSVLELL